MDYDLFLKTIKDNISHIDELSKSKKRYLLKTRRKLAIIIKKVIKNIEPHINNLI